MATCNWTLLECIMTTEGRTDRGERELLRDRLSTRLMETFRTTGNPLAFGLLYELNLRLFLAIVPRYLYRFHLALDPMDVVQETFFNIHRYSQGFRADSDQAFRSWGSVSLRNTAFRCARRMRRELGRREHGEEMEDLVDPRGRTPLGEAICHEAEQAAPRTYVVFLRLYLAAYQGLGPREQRALHLAEIEGRTYRAGAEELGIRKDNFKMVVFRARKKILREIDRVLTAGQEAAEQRRKRGSRRLTSRAGARGGCAGSPGSPAGAPARCGRT